MTSASELFHSRRSRFGRNSHVSDLGFGGSSPERTLRSGPGRRHHGHHRHDTEVCDLLRRSPRRASNRLTHPERESVRLNDGTGHSGSSNSVNIEASINGPSLPGNDRLPGAVLLARERLLQRLRGVSLSENRRNITTLTVSRSRSMISNNLGDYDAEDMEPEISTGLSTGNTLLAEVASQLEHLQLLQQSKKKPPGLTQEALDSVHLEVFTSAEQEKGAPRTSWDCSICLESFTTGDKLIRLPCGHRFHFVCLDPWVRACGDCPYCRRGIVETVGT